MSDFDNAMYRYRKPFGPPSIATPPFLPQVDVSQQMDDTPPPPPMTDAPPPMPAPSPTRASAVPPPAPQPDLPPAPALPPQPGKPSLGRQIGGTALKVLGLGELGERVEHPGYVPQMEQYNRQMQRREALSKQNTEAASAEWQRAHAEVFRRQTAAKEKTPKEQFDELMQVPGMTPEMANRRLLGGKPADTKYITHGSDQGVFDTDTGRDVVTGAPKPKALKFDHFTDENTGDVTSIGFDPDTGEVTSTKHFPGIAKKRPAVNVSVQDKAGERDAVNRVLSDPRVQGDWSKISALGFGEVQKIAGTYAGNVWQLTPKAQATENKLTDLKGDDNRRVNSANTAVTQIQRAIEQIDNVQKTHPGLTGWLGNQGARVEDFFGKTPAEIAQADSAIESAVALQPGQHNFRSIQAAEAFKKALGIDPKSGKADGSRQWLKNPAAAKAALMEVLKFNQSLRDNILNKKKSAPAGQPSVGAGSVVQTPNGAVDLTQFHK